MTVKAGLDGEIEIVQQCYQCMVIGWMHSQKMQFGKHLQMHSNTERKYKR